MEVINVAGPKYMRLNPKIGSEVPRNNRFVREKGQEKVIGFLEDYLPLIMGNTHWV